MYDEHLLSTEEEISTIWDMWDDTNATQQLPFAKSYKERIVFPNQAKMTSVLVIEQ